MDDSQQNQSRRTFLKATVSASAVACSPLVVPAVHASSDNAIKIGMIGCGGRCSGAAAAALDVGPDVQLVAMTDVFEDRMLSAKKILQNKYASQFLGTDETCVHGLDGYRTVIEAADAVLIACASKYHAYYAEEAIRAGKHVFIEKPHAIDPAGCLKLREACDLATQKGLSLVSGHESRYSTAYQEQVERIHDGAIGDLVAIQSMFLRAPYRVVQRNPQLSEVEYQFSNWYHFCWLSGDDVTQSLIHNLDRMRWVMQEENPEWCFGLGGRSSSFGEVFGDMFDHDTVVYEMPSGIRLYAMCQTRAGCYASWDDIIMGTKGTCYWSDCRIEGETNWQFSGVHNNPHAEEQKILIGSIRSGNPVNHQATMIDSTYMAIMGQIATYTGQPVRWNELLASSFAFQPTVEEATLEMDPPTVPDASGNYPLPHPGLHKIL